MNDLREVEESSLLKFLKDRLEFRYKMFMEWAFADNRIIKDINKFNKETKEVEDEIIILTKKYAKLGE